MNMQNVLTGIIALLLGTIVYAMDWQREQDHKLNELDKLITKQSTLLEMQIKLNEIQAKNRAKGKVMIRDRTDKAVRR